MAAISLRSSYIKVQPKRKGAYFRIHRNVKLFQGRIDLYVLFKGNKRNCTSFGQASAVTLGSKVRPQEEQKTRGKQVDTRERLVEVYERILMLFKLNGQEFSGSLSVMSVI